MKKKSKWKKVLALLIIIAVIGACGYVAMFGAGNGAQGSAKNITLGLDLAGGVSITYQADEEDPSAEDMSDTRYKLQRRVEAYSTEAEVYQEGSNRISVEIPGYYDAEKVLSELGNPGTVEFYEPADDASAENQIILSMNGGFDPEGFNLVMDGNDVADAQVATENDGYGNSQYVVSLTLTEEGTEKFAEATERNVGNPIYIVYDGQVISAPTVNETISDGQCSISGDFSYDSANSLATSIRLGALKLNLTEIQSSVVGARLGYEAVTTSLMAGAIGLVIIMIFMIVIYRIPGLASAIALVFYVLAMLLLLNGLDVTLTLPGIAGIILSIGMAVDANVIIFTRIKEEISAGKSVLNAIQAGFHKALSAILDGNITTLIAAAVLYLMGSGSIRGFATTLALGVVLSMFTALAVTRLILHIFYALGLDKEKYYGRAAVFKAFDFVGKKKYFYAIPAIILVAGVIFMGINHAGGKGILNYGLDFTGGTSMTVPFSEQIQVASDEGSELLAAITDTVGSGDVQLQNVQGSNDIMIKTQTLDQETRDSLRDMLSQQYGVDKEAITESNVSGVVSGEMQRDAVVSVIIAGICMLIYIWIRFKDITFGASAVLALLHDVLMVLMLYAFVRISVGNTFIACMLTIVGYSINATIVIFDRIRENRKTMNTDDLKVIVNASINQTLTRSINTSLTTFISIGVLYIMGVTSIREFALPLMVGIVCGAYSSIFISGTLWDIMQSRFGKKTVKAVK